jgi:hypothetical protein
MKQNYYAVIVSSSNDALPDAAGRAVAEVRSGRDR